MKSLSSPKAIRTSLSAVCFSIGLAVPIALSWPTEVIAQDGNEPEGFAEWTIRISRDSTYYVSVSRDSDGVVRPRTSGARPSPRMLPITVEDEDGATLTIDYDSRDDVYTYEVMFAAYAPEPLACSHRVCNAGIETSSCDPNPEFHCTFVEYGGIAISCSGYACPSDPGGPGDPPPKPCEDLESKTCVLVDASWHEDP
jgi:hypothetical protein